MESPHFPLIGVLLLSLALLCHCHYHNCDTEKQYELSKRCCSKCQPGFYMTLECYASKDTTCSPCGPNEYMPSWNDDQKCFSHQICDSGKALKMVFGGNSTSPRKCVCEEGYHFNHDYDFCKENTKCAPGYGVNYPVKLNTDTICIACHVGYFSNSTSSKEPCKPWTNCSKFGLTEIVPGSNLSDAVCDQSVKILNRQRTIILFVLALVFLILQTIFIILFCAKRLKDLKGNLEGWTNQFCLRFQAAEKKSTCNVCTSKNSQEQGHQYPTPYVAVNTDMALESEKECNTSISLYLQNAIQYEMTQGESYPTENEYPEQKTEISIENVNHVTGGEYMADTGYTCQDSHHIKFPCNVCQGCSHSSCPNPHYLRQNSSGQFAREFKDTRAGNNNNIFNCREPSDITDGCCPQFSSSFFTSQNHFSPNMTGSENTSCHSFGSSNESTPISETPPQIGQVTGNNNTTVISKGSVTNIKAEILVLFASPSSLDVSTTPKNGEENIGKSVQEENHRHCDSFVANTENLVGKNAEYFDIPIISASHVLTTNDKHRPENPLRDHGQNNAAFFQNVCLASVQEEGKPEES